MEALQGKTAVITGAGSGIGAATARRFAVEGARVVVVDRDLESAQQVAADIGPLARHVAIDIAVEEEVETAFRTLEDEGWAPDVVLANAGVQLFGRDSRILDLDLHTWQETLDVNLTGTFLTVKYAVRTLQGRGGSIILTGSPTGLTGDGRDYTAYSTSKAAIHGLARTVAAGYADQDIRVNVVVPGYTETPLVTAISGDVEARSETVSRIPLGRPGTVRDVEGIMVFLASDDSSFATGATFTVDGGATTL